MRLYDLFQVFGMEWVRFQQYGKPKTDSRVSFPL